jgi:ABC-type glycerol-3-phosphate transport system permease component
MNDTPWAFRAAGVAVCLSLIAAMGYPVLWGIFAATKSNLDLVANPFGPPLNPQFDNIISLWAGGDFLRFLRNTMTVALASVGGLVPMSAMAAYVFARRRLRYVDFLFRIILVGIMIPGQAIMIPVFRIMGLLGLRNTLWSLILLHLAWTPFGIFLLRAYFLSVPAELSDAALIDGCTEYGVFWRVYLPLAKPAMVTVAIFNFIWSWNDFLWPLILVQDPEWYTVQQAVMRFQTQFQVDWSMRNAGLVFAFLPPLAFYLLFRKGIQSGLTRGAVKM